MRQESAKTGVSDPPQLNKYRSTKSMAQALASRFSQAEIQAQIFKQRSMSVGANRQGAKRLKQEDIDAEIIRQLKNEILKLERALQEKDRLIDDLTEENKRLLRGVL